ncbi:hypothetical protein BJX70DRAFT_177596 [Aspergillus crustosus]
MGHKVSVVTGVKSENFTQPGNAVNEIWVGDTEIISRLPFAGSDMDQAGWGKDGAPKIPWHNFIIPLKRDIHEIHEIVDFNHNVNFSSIVDVPPNILVCCNRDGCMSNAQLTDVVITNTHLNQNPWLFIIAFAVMNFSITALLYIALIRLNNPIIHDSKTRYDESEVQRSAFEALFTTRLLAVGGASVCLGAVLFLYAHQAYLLSSRYLLCVVYSYSSVTLFSACLAVWAVHSLNKHRDKVWEAFQRQREERIA